MTESSRRFHLTVRLRSPSSDASARPESLPHRLAASYKTDGVYLGACLGRVALERRRIRTGWSDAHSCHTQVWLSRSGSFGLDCERLLLDRNREQNHSFTNHCLHATTPFALLRLGGRVLALFPEDLGAGCVALMGFEGS